MAQWKSVELLTGRSQVKIPARIESIFYRCMPHIACSLVDLAVMSTWTVQCWFDDETERVLCYVIW